MAKRKIKIKINAHLRRVRTRLGRRQRVIKAHKRLVIRDFRSSGKNELAKEFFVNRFGKSPEQHSKEFEQWKRQNLSSSPSFGGINDMARFKEINDMIRRRKDIILMGSDTLYPETARKKAMDELVMEGKIKRTELKNHGSSPTTGTAKPSDTLLVEALQRNKKLKQKSVFKNKFEINLSEIEDLASK